MDCSARMCRLAGAIFIFALAGIWLSPLPCSLGLIVESPVAKYAPGQGDFNPLAWFSASLSKQESRLDPADADLVVIVPAYSLERSVREAIGDVRQRCGVRAVHLHSEWWATPLIVAVKDDRIIAVQEIVDHSIYYIDSYVRFQAGVDMSVSMNEFDQLVVCTMH